MTTTLNVFQWLVYCYDLAISLYENKQKENNQKIIFKQNMNSKNSRKIKLVIRKLGK